MQHSLIKTEGGEQVLTLFVPGDDKSPYIAHDTHPNFKAIVTALICGDEVEADEVVELFDIASTVASKFERLSERVTVENGVIFFDGDEVNGTLQDQILDFLSSGEDFEPLVDFYEKLATNPLGDVREGLYDFIIGQKANGTFTITEDGNIIGYKACHAHVTDDGETVYRPSRVSREGGDRVNGVEVPAGSYIEQQPGDVVEMPRSKVLHAPSQECGDGLHIGTYQYASTFLSGGTVLLVEFSPRDIVSLPDSNASWKLRVCRYTVLDVADGPLDVPLYQGVRPADEAAPASSLDEDDEECDECGEDLADCECEDYEIL